MNSRLMKIFSIIGIVLIYTAFKATQLLPDQPLIAVALTFLLFFFMLGGTFISRANPDVMEKSWFHVFLWIGSLAMGIWATFFLISLPVDLIHLFFSSPYFSQDLYLLILGFSILISVIGFIQVLLGPSVKNVSLPTRDLHPSLKGLKIAQISDLHVGPTVRKRYVERIVQRTNALEPDLIFVTGDLADAHAPSITVDLEPLRNLKSKFGVFYVTGNHEYYWGADGLIAKTRELGFTPLINENRVVKIGDAKVLISGITDPMGTYMIKGHAPDVKKSLESDQVTDFKILLAHRPDAYLEAEPLGFNLQFSGHTHSGQFFPFSLFIGLAHKYHRGLHKHGRLWLYVNPGTGYWGPANRFGVPAEITALTVT